MIEDESSINDGLWWPGDPLNSSSVDWLSTRHDLKTKTKKQQYNPIAVNSKAKVNVSFLDGHVEWIEKDKAHNNPYNIPKNYKFQ